MIYLTEYGLEKLIRKFKAKNKEWSKVSTKNNVHYTIGKAKFYQGQTNRFGFSKKELGLINSVKIQLQKFSKSLKKDYTGIDMFNGFSSELKYNKICKEGVQIDINSAYLSLLKNEGAIKEETYNKFYELEDIKKMSDRKKEFKVGNKDYRNRGGGILKVSKSCRLVAVGTVATQKNIEHYKGSEVVGTKFVYNQSEANVFFYAAYKVGEIMKEIMECCDGWFFWVDCVFMPVEHIEKAFKIFEKNGLDFHWDDIEMRYERLQWNVRFNVINKGTGEIKDYFFRYSKAWDVSGLVSDPKRIIEIYNSLDSGLSIYKLSKRCAKLKIQIPDLYNIKGKFALLDDLEDSSKVLLAILILIEKDITLLF